jgi:hypothetical protein
MYDTAADRHEIFSTRRVAPVLGLALLFALGIAHGQDLQAAQACTRLGDDAARLLCYDTAMGRFRSASGGPKPQSAPPTSVATEAEAKFGDDGRLHTQTKPSLPKKMSAQVREVTVLPAGLYRLVLDNGQVWDTTQAVSALAFKANDAVTITHGLLGSHQISLTGHSTSVSVIRKQ